MGIPLSKKLEQLGASGRARLERAWADPEVSNATIVERFGLNHCDIEGLKALFGPRPEKARAFVWRRRDDERTALAKARRSGR